MQKGDGMMSDSNRGYAGRIQNTGAQKVKAPFSTGAKKGKTTVKTGNDLRTGRSGK